MDRIAAVVPARLCNDEGKNNKDILPFGDNNLLIHKIRQLKQVDNIDILVSSESDEILEMARSEGVKAIKRPIELAKSDALFGDLVEYICKEVDYEHIMWSCVTSPLITPSIYSKAIGLYFESIKNDFDSKYNPIAFE